MTAKSDVPLQNNVIETQSAFEDYQRLFYQQQQELMDNADGYANRRERKRKDLPFDRRKLAKKVFTEALFVPAHPDRFIPRGEGIGPQYKYFVIHRPNSVYQGKPLKLLVGKAYLDCVLSCTAVSMIKWFSMPPPGVPTASHFIVDKTGLITQMVDLDDVAPHLKSGRAPDGQLVTNYNAAGVEVEGAIESAVTEAAYIAVAKILRMMADVYGISLDTTHVLRHSDIQTDRRDPGDEFNMDHVLDIAKSSPVLAGAAFQPPIDLRTSTAIAFTRAFPNVLAMTAGLNKSTQITLVAGMKAASRAAELANVTRDDLFSRAIGHVETQARGGFAFSTEKLALIIALKDVKVNPQTNVKGLLKNWTDGKWNDE